MKTKSFNVSLLFLSALAVVSGCVQTEEASSIESSVVYADPFDDPNVTEQFLEENLCMDFEDLRFIKGGEKDHVYVVDGEKISLHKSYAKKKTSLSDFSKIANLSLFDALDIIGTPSFRGKYDTSCLSYVISSDSYVNVNVEKDSKGVWLVTSYDEYDEKAFSDYFGQYYMNDSPRQRRQHVPSLERVLSIEMGMSFDDVLFILGMPDSGTYRGLPSDKTCGGTWYFDAYLIEYIMVGTRWIGSDYPTFDINNCQDGLSTYCGVIDIYLHTS